MKQVLLVGEDDGLSFLAEALGLAQFACTGRRMSELADETAFSQCDLVLLDAPLVDGEILGLCRRLRTSLSVPIVLCSMSNEESDIIESFSAGVDDYLVLPMRPAEVSARITALLRRSTKDQLQDSQPSVVRAGDVEIDVENRRVVRGGEDIYLSPTEFRLLAALIRGNGRAVSHTKLLSAVWGPEYVDSRNYLRLYVTYLRSKLESDPHRPRLIVNEWGVGYRFNAEAS